MTSVKTIWLHGRLSDSPCICTGSSTTFRRSSRSLREGALGSNDGSNRFASDCSLEKDDQHKGTVYGRLFDGIDRQIDGQLATFSSPLNNRDRSSVVLDVGSSLVLSDDRSEIPERMVH
jgi:hypothetical protein